MVLAGADSQMNGRICQGVVSSSSRMPQVLDEGYFGQYFLIDASSASPASGWLVLNLNGEVVGILGQSTARIYKSQGECVALGANQVHQVADLLAQGSTIQRSYVGLNLQQLTGDLAAARHLKTTAGALVSDVVPGGPAEKAGLVPGDVVLKVASTPISQYGQVRAVVADLPSDKPVSFQIDRQGVAQTVAVTPARHPMQVIATRNENPPTRGTASASGSALDGISVEELPDLPGVPKTGNQPKRVAITSIDYLQVIPSMPIEAGMLVLEVDGQTITSRADFEVCKEKMQGQSVVSLRIDTMGKRRYLTLRAVQ
jgi:serine protease Do